MRKLRSSSRRLCRPIRPTPAPCRPWWTRSRPTLVAIPSESSPTPATAPRRNINHLKSAGIDGYIATGRESHGPSSSSSPRGRIPSGLTPTQRMARKLSTNRPVALTMPAARPSSNQYSARSKEAGGFRRFKPAWTSARSPRRMAACLRRPQHAESCSGAARRARRCPAGAIRQFEPAAGPWDNGRERSTRPRPRTISALRPENHP